jgi:hypothetical protein
MDSILNERWFSLSLVEQMINIGNEVKRAVRFDANEKKRQYFWTRHWSILTSR